MADLGLTIFTVGVVVTLAQMVKQLLAADKRTVTGPLHGPVTK